MGAAVPGSARAARKKAFKPPQLGPGSVIGIDCLREPGRVSIAVEDRGTPVPAEYREKIFDRFYRADKARSREIEGSGLERLHGDIRTAACERADHDHANGLGSGA